MKKYCVLLFLISCAFCANTTQIGEISLGSIVVTAKQTEPTQVFIDPKSAIQPMPANDGAGLLKTIPNISLTRKGGSSSDPLFRGLGGSRLAVTANNGFLYGGCGGRMDPPTAYISPNSYDSVVITKGPQSVTQGGGLIAGSVQFLRDNVRFDETDAFGDGGITVGSFGRFDAYADVTAGLRQGYIRVDATHSESDDYEDGGGNKIHSNFKRDSQTAQLGITPDEYSLIEFTYDRSRGEAALADRGMDGSLFDRDAYGVKLSRESIGDFIDKISLKYSHSYVDHVMDNYNLREHTSGMFMASNPDRRTNSAGLGADISYSILNAKVGIDWTDDRHRGRSGSAMSASAADTAYKNARRNTNQEADNLGIFAEFDVNLNAQNRLVFGLRHDKSGVDYFSGGNKTDEQDFNLNAAFLRYEYSQKEFTYFAGLGLSQRLPDFWERNRSHFLDKESNTELDIGMLYKGESLSGSLTLFASEIDDFILIDTTATPNARNIDARRYGFEGEISWEFIRDWTLSNALAYTYGKNRSDSAPLAQTPPFEMTSRLLYDNDEWAFGLVARFVSPQHRTAVGQGNIIGQDIDESSGFAVFSLNGSWKINQNIGLYFGVDNIFNKEYSEFISKSSADIAGYAPATHTQINEPGRQFWARVQGRF